MSPDAELAWRKCPGCGYLVPGASATCLRCHTDLSAPAAWAPGEGASAPGFDAAPSPWSVAASSTEAASRPSPPTVERPGFAPAPPWPPVPAVGGGPPPAASAEYLPVGRGGSGGSRRTWWVVIAIVVIVALVGTLLRLTVFDGTVSYPAHWDPRLGDLPRTVAELRKLDFVHPVPVRFLSEKEFRKETAFDPGSTPGAKRQLQKLTESLRAAGLVTGSIDLGQAVNDEQQSSVLAFYDPDTKQVVVRGTGPLDVATRVTLAHELTHVLQDQHFDLNRLQASARSDADGSGDAFRAFVEGDAVRIEDKYRARLSKAEKKQYARVQQAEQDRADEGTAQVPAYVSLLFSAPYRYGPPAVGVVASDGGNANVDRGFRSGSFTERLFLEPNSVLHHHPEPKVAPPTLAKGEKASGAPDRFGAFGTYLLLASRLDPGRALEAASFVQGGRSRIVRSGGRACVRGVVLGADATANRLLVGAFGDWARALPKGMAEIGRRGAAVTFFSCDPGAKAALPSPDSSIERAGTLLQIHDELEAGLISELAGAGIPAQRAECAALGLTRSPAVGLILQQPEADITEQQLTDAITTAAPQVRDECGF